MSPVIKLSSPSTQEHWELPVVYEDDVLLALDKPAGMWTSPSPFEPERPNLIQLLHSGIADQNPWARARGLSYLMNAHQLEPEVSGIVLLAKSKSVLGKLTNLFGSEKPVLAYAALVQGEPARDEFSVEAALAPHPIRPHVMRVDSRHGKKARTRFQVLQRFSGWTLLKCEPLTHRTHQIRAHLRFAGLPIVGDAAYGGKPLWLSRLKSDYRLKPNRSERPLIGSVALHAESLTVPHPVSGQSMLLTAPRQKDMRVGIKYLQRFAPASASAPPLPPPPVG